MRSLGQSSPAPVCPSSQAISVEPPPMSKMMTDPALGWASEEQPITASVASVCRSTTSMSRPISVRTRSMKAGPFWASRHASVAMSRERTTLRLSIFALHTRSAESVRSIASSPSRSPIPSPSPSRTMRENASTTRNS